MLSKGQTAPEFTFVTSSGEKKSTASLKGSPYLVYFYPRDDTPGCTTEACEFRDQADAFAAAGLTIIGVSADSEKSHDKFRHKHNLPFPLVSDTELTVCQAFGVWGPKKFMGRTFDGIHRTTFVVDKEGKIAHVYSKVKPEAHAQQILNDLTTYL